MYKKSIEDYLAKRGWTDVTPRVIEAYMRLTYGTLSHLDPARFRRAIAAARKEALSGGHELNDSLAKSYGL